MSGFRRKNIATTPWTRGSRAEITAALIRQDAKELVKLNTEGRMRLVDGDNVEIFPGIRAYTGARHTYASQYLKVDGKSALRAGFGQLLFLSQPVVAFGQRHV